VRLDPPVEDIKPSPNRCFGLVPRESRTYTLVALGDDGIEVRESFRIQVDDKPAAPARKQDSMIQFFTANATEVPTGQNVTICYGVQGAHKLTLHPGSRPLEPVPRNCIMTRVTEATTFKLVADGPSGRVETESLTIRTR
jgi:hypothetical protein